MKTVRLGDIIEVNKNSITSKDNFDKIYYLDTGSITQNNIESYQEFDFNSDKMPSRAKRKVKDKTIIYSTVRPNQKHYGYMENPKENIIVSTGFCTLDVKDKEFDPKFIYYLLTQDYVTDYLHTIGTNSVSSYPAINPNDIANLKFKIPNLKTQQSIAKILSQLDQKIALNNQINAQLEQMAKTLYDYWFVQFDFPDGNGKPYKSSGGEMVYNEQLKREIPKGWGVGVLSDITECLDAKRKPLSSKERKDRKGGIPYYGATGIFDYIDDFIFDGDYVLLAEDGSIINDHGNPILQRITGKSWVNNHAHILSPKKNYGCYLLMMLLKDVSVVGIQTGSIQLKITQENMNNIPLFLIPESLKKSINDILNPIDNKILLNKKQNQQLTQLRDFLLPMLMNGQVGVRDE